MAHDSSTPTSAPKPASTDPLHPQTSTGGTLVLQWLTYAFWGWFIIALIWLIAVILTNVVLGDPVNTIIPYAIAATIVLLPIAFVCDLFYRKHEPLRKAGAAMVIMLIHAVIFALFAIGALITAVFTGLNAIINATDDTATATTVIILTATASALLFGVAFLRTLNPFKKKLGAKIYAWAMLGLAILLIIIAFVGPVIQSVATRSDRAIEDALPSVSYAVQDYVRDHDTLPTSLDQLTLTSAKAKEAVQQHKFEYISEGVDMSLNNVSTSYRYQLCVTYKQASKASRYDSSYDRSTDGYSTYPSATPHDAGRVCYKLRTY